jgi:predicted CoA-binding protein
LQGAQYSVFTLSAQHLPWKNGIVRAMSHANSSPDEIRQMLRSNHSIAVVGLPPNLVQPSFQVAHTMRVWLRDGMIHKAAAQRARGAGTAVAMNRCVWRDYNQLCAGRR